MLLCARGKQRNTHKKKLRNRKKERRGLGWVNNTHSTPNHSVVFTYTTHHRSKTKGKEEEEEPRLRFVVDVDGTFHFVDWRYDAAAAAGKKLVSEICGCKMGACICMCVCGRGRPASIQDSHRTKLTAQNKIRRHNPQQLFFCCPLFCVPVFLLSTPLLSLTLLKRVERTHAQKTHTHTLKDWRGESSERGSPLADCFAHRESNSENERTTKWRAEFWIQMRTHECWLNEREREKIRDHKSGSRVF